MANKSKKSTKQRKLEQQYMAQRRRITKYIKEKEEIGFEFDFVMPDKPKRITEASVNRLKKITSTELRKKALITTVDFAKDKLIKQPAISVSVQEARNAHYSVIYYNSIVQEYGSYANYYDFISSIQDKEDVLDVSEEWLYDELIDRIYKTIDWSYYQTDDQQEVLRELARSIVEEHIDFIRETGDFTEFDKIIYEADIINPELWYLIEEYGYEEGIRLYRLRKEKRLSRNKEYAKRVNRSFRK